MCAEKKLADLCWGDEDQVVPLGPCKNPHSMPARETNRPTQSHRMLVPEKNIPPLLYISDRQPRNRESRPLPNPVSITEARVVPEMW